MPMSTIDFKSLTGGLLAAAMLAAPMMGCSGGGGDDDDTTPPSGTATPTPTAAQTPTPGVSGAFPGGQFYYQFAYVLNFRDIPYILTFIGYVWDDNHVPARMTPANGDWNGQFILVAWNDRASYEADADPDCYMYENVTATDHASGTDPDVDYSTCQFCNPFSDWYSIFYDASTTCEQELFDIWYYDDEAGDYDYEFYQYAGYRDAGNDGWPGEYADSADALTNNGWVGTLYDTLSDLIIEGEADFFPGYFVAPTDLNSSKVVPGKLPYPLDKEHTIEIELNSIKDLRKFMGR